MTITTKFDLSQRVQVQSTGEEGSIVAIQPYVEEGGQRDNTKYLVRLDFGVRNSYDESELEPVEAIASPQPRTARDMVGPQNPPKTKAMRGWG